MRQNLGPHLDFESVTFLYLYLGYKVITFLGLTCRLRHQWRPYLSLSHIFALSVESAAKLKHFDVYSSFILITNPDLCFPDHSHRWKIVDDTDR